MTTWFARTGLLAGAALAAVLVDLVTKWLVLALDPAAVAFHPSAVPWRLVILLPVAVLGLPLLTGRAGAAASGLVIGGSLANTLSLRLWSPGVPDFVPVPGGLANSADVEIAIGLLLVLLVLVAPPLRRSSEALSRARATGRRRRTGEP